MVNAIFPVDLRQCNNTDTPPAEGYGARTSKTSIATLRNGSIQVADSEAPFHAHVYYSPQERDVAASLRARSLRAVSGRCLDFAVRAPRALSRR